MVQFTHLLQKIKETVEGDGTKNEKLLKICQLLTSVPHYNWVGFYFVEGKELILGPFIEEPTEHVRIAFGQGICGQAAAQKSTFIVQDVSKESNYLSCSPKVKAEIVIPIFKEGRIAGELDIDSHYPSPFKHEDKIFLEEVAKIVADIL